MRFNTFSTVASLSLLSTLVSANELKYKRTFHNPGNHCGNVNADLVVAFRHYDNSQHKWVYTKNEGHIQACLCYSDLDAFVASNSVALSAVHDVGNTQTELVLKYLIDHSNSHSICFYPDHSVGDCQTNDVCNFDCVNGFMKKSGQCKCDAPNVVCNGFCRPSSACPSSVPVNPGANPNTPYKRDLDWYMTAGCRAGQTACGVFGGSSKAWDCVDTQSDLESCGGCILPLHSATPRGVDCTTIAGADDVMCVAGSCVVQRCMRGWKLSHDGGACVREGAASDSPSHLNRIPVDAAAADYGLEHHAFGKHSHKHGQSY